MLRKKFSEIYIRIASFNRKKFINSKNRKLLKNNELTLISSNCTGAFIQNDLNLKFLTPTINLFFFANDFVKFAENLNFYLNENLEVVSTDKYKYPVGRIKDIDIHFMHYKSFEEAKEQWENRTKRINFDNIFIMMTYRDGCNEETIKRFEKLPYKNKVLFTNREFKQYPSTFYIKGFENQECVGHIYKYVNILGKKYYDNFNYVKWFNNKY
jgi:uncharacterized protein (DUF1919 family)